MDIGYMLKSMMIFASEYCMAKCIRTMIAGMAVLPIILTVRKCNRPGRADINFYAMLMLLPAALTGSSKLFFTGYLVYIPVILYGIVKPIHGMVYFGVMTFLLARYLWKNRRLARYVRTLPIWEDAEELQGAVALLRGRSANAGTGRKASFSLRERYLRRVKVYVTGEAVSPFSGGIRHPYVVVPEKMLVSWQKEEFRAVLCHELIHIKSGHILWTALFQLLKIYWWGNPMIYLCERLLREDMEMVCDEQCIRYANVSCGTYGRTLLNMIALMQDVSPEGTLCFSEKKDFQIMKRRIESLAVSMGKQNTCGQHRKHSVIFAGAFVGMILLIAGTSYPKYTKLDDIVMYDEELHMLDYNSDELREAVCVRDGRLLIDGERFAALLEKQDVQGEYVYLSYDTILKVPGSGGCGNVGMVAVADHSDIFYLASDGPDTLIEEFWLKYLI